MKSVSSILIIALVFCTQALFAADVYKGTDSSGKTIYSDKPFAGSDKIEVNTPQTYTSPPVTQIIDTNKKAVPITYQVSITSPIQDQTFTTDIKTIEVNVSVTPPLEKGDKIQLLLNGQPEGAPSEATTFTLQSLFRGAYRVQAQVISNSTPVAQSPEVTFYQRRTSIQ